MSSICQICLKNPATAHLSEINEQSGEMQELHICNSCAAKLHLDLPNNPPSIADILSMAQADAQDEPEVDVELDISFSSEDAEEESLHCPDCGISFEQFSKNNRFGCANDYEIFKDQLEQLFDELHGAKQHIGRGPNNSDQHAQLLANRIRLEKRLQDVIAEERFEEAARIRDQLKELDE